MSLQALSDYTIISRYSSYLKDKKRRETWSEMTDRVFKMHATKYTEHLENEEFKIEFDFAKEFVKKKRVLGSQRALQFGGEPIFKHNSKIYNCLAQETKFVTSTGVRSFFDFEDGDDIIVPTHTGNWKHAKVKSYGRQKLYEIGFRRGEATHTIFATENHKWLLDDGSETTNLKVGDSLLAAANTFAEFDYDNATPFEKLYWCYGYVFGDGTKVKRNGVYEYTMVRLCGNDVKYESRFVEMGFKTSTSLSLNGDIMCYTGKYLKNTPDPTQDSIEQVRAFVHGYLSADGAKNTNPERTSPFLSIQSSDIDHIDFIRECFPMVGMYIISERDLTGQVTNFGTRPYTMSFKINNSTGRNNKYSSKFNVEYIKDSGRFETVWCLEVEDDHSLILPFGMVTGNCSYGYIDRVAAFSEAMYLLLCGCGVGFSVQKKHVSRLPDIVSNTVYPDGRLTYDYQPEDSIEGWAECVRVLCESYFVGDSIYMNKNINFDLSKIRPEGSMIAGRFKAPGPEGLRSSLEKMKQVFETRLSSGETRLRSIDVYDLIMHASDAVLSGGVRRSATICLFSKDDPEMMSAKTGDWFIKNPQRGRSNNSVLLLKEEITKEEFAAIMKSTREFGEPGFVFSDSEDIGYNPCVEIGMYPQTEDGRSGWQFCNLCEINGKYCDTDEKFYDCCRVAATIGTMQSGYTQFTYLSKETQEITEREALLGCSITGIMDNPDILLSPEIQRKGAEIIKAINKKVAALIGIRQAARTTAVKPAGSTSCVLSTGSGIHPHHAKRYIRRVQANRAEFPLQHFQKINPLAVEKSVWSANGTDYVISFLCEVPKNAITKNKMGAVELLRKVQLTQQNWIEYGTNPECCVVPYVRHNVSNTITVKEDEWQDIEDYIFENRKWFAGISLLAASGDLDYPQAPFTSVLDAKELVEEYGEGSLMASGLIVDGLAAFNNNLWAACDSVNGIGEVVNIIPEPIEPNIPSKNKTKADLENVLTYFNELELYEKNFKKLDWIRRSKQFSERYFDGNIKKMCHCLKHSYSYKQWLDLKREYVEIDWTDATEDTETFVNADTMAGAACSSGQCELI